MPMKTFLPFLSLIALAAALFAAGSAQSDDKLDAKQLRTMIEGLGYEIKVLNAEAGKEKYEFVVKRGGLDIPIAAEVSASKNYVWLTVFLGEAPKDDAPSTKFSQYLKKNFQTQPCHFYVTSRGSLMLGIPMDNRAITAPWLRKCVDKIAEDTDSTRDLWEK